MESFHLIAKNTGLRKVFLKPSVLHVLLRHALMICNNKEVNERTKALKEETIKLLCILSTVKTSRFYIPGETNIVERLRKDAFDRGLYTTLTYIYKALDKRGSHNEIKKYIKEKVLNLIELNDLVYHTNVIETYIEMLKTNPYNLEE